MFSLSSVLSERQITPGLVFLSECPDGLEVLNLGGELVAELSQTDLNQSSLPMIANDMICNMLNHSIADSAEGKKYIAIDNIAILFEPQLSLDIEALFKSFSRSAVLIISTKPTIADKCYFPFEGCPSIKVDLTGIPYCVLQR